MNSDDVLMLAIFTGIILLGIGLIAFEKKVRAFIEQPKLRWLWIVLGALLAVVSVGAGAFGLVEGIDTERISITGLAIVFLICVAAYKAAMTAKDFVALAGDGLELRHSRLKQSDLSNEEKQTAFEKDQVTLLSGLALAGVIVIIFLILGLYIFVVVPGQLAAASQ